MDLQNKYQILASEFSKVRGQVTVLKKAVIDEQSKNQQLQEDVNRKDQNLRRNGQEIETLTFLNTQLKSRLEILQQELNEVDTYSKLKKSSSNKIVQNNSFNDNVLAQELEQKIKQYETIHRRVYELEKQIADAETERSAHHSNIEQLQNQMTEMQQSHQRARDEYERILKQIKQENELLNEQVKQHLTEQPSSVPVSRKTSILNPPTKPVIEPSPPSPQPEIFLYKCLIAWRDAFTELTIYIEERLKNNNRSSENNEKMAQTVKAFQQHAENFLVELKIRLFDGQCSLSGENSTNFAELFSMFVSSCEKVLALAIKSVCDEPIVNPSSENQGKIYEKINQLNHALNQLFQRWSNNLSQLREIAVAIIQFDLSLPTTAEQLQVKVTEILTTFQNGSLIHCDLDKNYNDKLCLEYELTASPVHLTTTDECILAALRKLASLEQQISQLIRENQTYLFELQKRQKENSQQEDLLIGLSNNPHQQILNNQKRQNLYNAETIGTLEQEKEHWRLEYQLLKIKFEKMRDDHSKQIEELKDKTNQTVTTNEQLDELISTSPTTSPINVHREHRTTSDPPSEREVMIKQYYSQKIVDLEGKLQVANGKSIAFYNELANIHQRLRYSKDQETKCRTEIEQSQQELTKMRDELSTTTKGYEEQIATMSEHLASMNELITAQNDKYDRLQQQLHTNPKDGKKGKK